MKVLIYDHLHAGHHFNTVRLLATACAAVAERVVIATTPVGGRSPEAAEHFKALPGNVEVDASAAFHPCDGKLWVGMREARLAWGALCDVVEQHQPDHLYVPCVDGLRQAAFFSRRRLAIDPAHADAIVVSAPFAYEGLPVRRRVRAALELAALERLPFGRVLFLDEIAHRWVLDHRPRLAPRAVVSPDPVAPVLTAPRNEARRRLGLSPEGRIASCVGVLDSRKGVDEFVRAFAADPGLRPDDRLLLAGRASADVKSAISTAAGVLGEGRIVLMDRTLPHEEFSLTICASDLVAVPYRFPDHIGCASIALRAIAAGRPVLADEQGWPGEMTRRHELGWIYQRERSGKAGEISAALGRSVDWTPGPKAQAFAEFHSEDRFCELLTRPLRKSTGVSITSERHILVPSPGTPGEG